MSIIRDELHPKNNAEDTIYPKTDITQVEGLQSSLDSKCNVNYTFLVSFNRI